MTVVDHVIVFGDSLSDIGRKWSQPMGMVASCIPEDGLRMLAVSATGRFSDSKNWTDYMFEDTAGQSLISPTREATIAASGEYHRLSSRWINPAGGSRFRYANYAVGGAVGWKASAITKKIGLTTFSDQVDEFEEDFAAVSRAGTQKIHNFLFIVMFGANDIYTDEKDSNVSKNIGNGIIKQCQRLEKILRGHGPSPAMVVAGVGYPHQSIFFVNNLEKLQSKEEKRQYNKKVAGIHGQVATLNTCLRQHCELTAPNWHYFSMRESLLALHEDAASLGIDVTKHQTVAQFERISHKKDNIHFHNPDNPSLRTPQGQRPLFTADQKHPTSHGYRYLWTRMHGLLSDKSLKFGLLAPPALAPLVIKNRVWQKDSEVHTCHKCHTKFGVFTRKHHCRECGCIFCDNCTKHRVTLDQPLIENGRDKRPGVKDCRVCDDCYRQLGS
jgi:phospholipase/lecithinase/hemolysin